MADVHPSPPCLRPRLLVVAVLLIAAALLAPAAASASATQESLFEDDSQLLAAGPSARDSALDEMRSLGADSVRVLVMWRNLAPAPSSTHAPAVDLTDPAAYSGWGPYDAVVAGARARGLGVILTPTAPGPAWASQCGGSISRRQTCNPDPAQFQRFVTALGRRYPDQRRWSIWNEPNVGAWLRPQFVRRGRTVVPSSPVRYRALVRAGVAGLAASGHGGDQVLFGETAPIGQATGPLETRQVPTATFWRTLLCIDARGGALRGASATNVGCGGGFARLAVSAAAHHPYTRGGSKPPLYPSRSDEITLGSIGRLERILDQAARRGRIAPRMPIYLTEYGVQTRPPDNLLGVPLSAQASYINQADFLAFRDGRLRSVSQYLLRDDPALGGFQTGLRFANGRAKPSLSAYALPLWVYRSGRSLAVWGLVRPAADGSTQRVEVQNRPPGGRFRTVGTTTVTNRKGYFVVRIATRRGSWRLRWTAPDGTVVTSRTAEVGR